jgi:hypothetical protein
VRRRPFSKRTNHANGSDQPRRRKIRSQTPPEAGDDAFAQLQKRRTHRFAFRKKKPKMPKTSIDFEIISIERKTISIEIIFLSIEIISLSIGMIFLSIEINFLSIGKIFLSIEMIFLSIEIISKSIEVSGIFRQRGK